MSIQKLELQLFAVQHLGAVRRAAGTLAKDLAQAVGTRKGLGKPELDWIEGQTRSFSNSKTTAEVARALFYDVYGNFTIIDAQKTEDEFVQYVSNAADNPRLMEDARKELAVARALYGKRRAPVVRRRRDKGPTPGEKVRDPVSYPTLTVSETMELFGKSRSTIYRWLDEGNLDEKKKLRRASLGKKPGKRVSCLILTESAKELLDEGAE